MRSGRRFTSEVKTSESPGVRGAHIASFISLMN